jgi:hypothetical protein
VLIQVASVENLGENPKAKKGPGRGIILDNKIDFLSGITMPYTAMADSAVTCWLPMTAISHDMGPLKIIPGSHREVWKVRFRRDLAGQSFAGPKRIEMANPDIENFERRSIEVTPMQPAIRCYSTVAFLIAVATIKAPDTGGFAIRDSAILPIRSSSNRAGRYRAHEIPSPSATIIRSKLHRIVSSFVLIERRVEP